MNISKKALKFTKQTAIQLKDSYSLRDDYDKEELKRTFIEAVKSISKKDIKTEILQNVDKYVKKLDKFLRKSQTRQHFREEKDLPEFVYSLYQQDGCQLQNTEGKTEKEREILVNQIIAERIHKDPEVLNLLDDFPPEDENFPQLSSCHKLLKLTSGSKHAETLRQIMLKYFRVVQTQAEDLVTEQETDRCSEMAKEIKNFVSVCHLRKQHCDQCGDEKKPSYEDILTSLLSLYVELFLQSKKSGNNKNKTGRQLCGFVKYLLPWQQHQLDLLLQLPSVTEEDATVILPLARAILKKTEEYPEEKIYLRQVLAVRSLHSKIGDAVDSINETMKSVSAPRKLLSWLQNQDAELLEEFPNDKKFKGTIVTKFLLEDATEEQIERLTDIFSYNEAEDEEQSPTDEPPSDETPSTKQKEDLEQLNFFIDTGVKQDKLESAASKDLFYIDKGGLALGQNKTEDRKDHSEDKNEADVAMDTDHNDNVDKMDKAIFHIDTSFNLTLKKDENKHLEENQTEIMTSDEQTLEADKHDSLEVNNVSMFDDNDQSPNKHDRKSLVPDAPVERERVVDKDLHNKSAKKSSKKLGSVEVYDGNCIENDKKRGRKTSLTSNEKEYSDVKQETYKSKKSLSDNTGNHGDNMDYSLVIEYQGTVKLSDESERGNVNHLKIRAQIGEEDSGIENIEDKNEEIVENPDKLRRNKRLSESSVASDLSTKGKQTIDQVKTIGQSPNTRRSTRSSECSICSDLNDGKSESVKDNSKLKDSQKKQTQIENFMVPRSKIKSWQDKFGGEEFQAGETNKRKELSPGVRKTRSGRRISSRISPGKHSSIASTTETSLDDSLQSLDVTAADDYDSSSSNKRERQKKRRKDTKNAEDLVVPDSHDEEFEDSPVLPNITQFMAKNDTESNLPGEVIDGGMKRKNELGTPRSLRKRKRSSESSTPRRISNQKISEESESVECLEMNDSMKKNLPRIIETEEFIVMSEPSSEGHHGESESSEKKEKSKKSKRRQSEPVSKIDTPNKTRRKSEAYSLKKGMTLRTRKSITSHD
ncbi:unnamed protein product [Mytilus coruscus]|uniref:Uncharacterized protein n=1 Tax=Mytilus coruscus TaxID=42192 RepID=A0A6J8B2P7_MYTCO|nr:unnamed protein product [Mytilus coruscus]